LIYFLILFGFITSNVNKKIQSINVHFRWNKKEIERAKAIAEQKGLKYQTYIKSTLKQQMDKDEKELGFDSENKFKKIS
jgi:predicted DNA binding CopG/RHH family protein